MRRKFPVIRKILLMAGDVILLLASTAVVVALLDALQLHAKISYATYIKMAPVMVVAAGILFNVNGLFSLARKPYSEIFMSLGVALFQVLIIMMAASFFLREFAYSRGVLIWTTIVQFVLLAGWRYLFWRAERALILPKKALLIGDEQACERILVRLRLQPHLQYHVRYICTECDSKPWQRVTEDIDLIIICDGLSLKAKAELVHFGHTHGKQIFIIPDAYELFCSSAVMDKIDDIPVFRPQYLKPTLEQRILKRTLDLSVAIPAFLLFLPLFPLFALMIKKDSPGPVFYSQVRVGRDEKEFSIYKFRTMYQDAEQRTGPVLASDNDPRITPVGRLLRAARMDELPQLLNVILGTMSIVGPRPERPFFVNQFKQEMPEYVYRHNVKPGITGMAQVHGKYNTTAYDKLVYDLLYIQNSNVLNDLRIMLQTVRVLISKKSTAGVNKKKSAVIDLAKYQIDSKL